jgi:hypothetical protein
MPEIKYIKCPSCGWVGDSEPTPAEIYESLKTEVPSVIKTLELNSSRKNYGFTGSYAICPNCGEDLSNGSLSVNPKYLVKEGESEQLTVKIQEDPYKWQLTKRILLEVQSSDAAYIYLDNFSENIKCNYLDFCFCIERCLDAGLLNKTPGSEIRLTWVGHDFLADASTEWEEIIQSVNKDTTVKDLIKMLENSAKKRYGVN